MTDRDRVESYIRIIERRAKALKQWEAIAGIIIESYREFVREENAEIFKLVKEYEKLSRIELAIDPLGEPIL